MREYMCTASRVILAASSCERTLNRALASRYTDPRGAVMWDRVTRLLDATEKETVLEGA